MMDDVEGPVTLPCGAIAEFDYNSMCAHRCTRCFAVVGSIAMPKECTDLLRMEAVAKKLKG